MNQILRIKDNIVQFLSPPSKRRRTLPVTPSTPIEGQTTTPQSELIGAREKAKVINRMSQAYEIAPHALQSRKRAREDDDEDEVRESAPGLGPDDSISQVEVEEDSDSAGEAHFDEEELEEDEDEELDPDEPSGEDKVAAWQARQAELAIRREQIELARGTNLHPDALFLTERIQLRSYEEIMPARWQIDFPSLPVELFTDDPAKQFINSNELSSYSGVRAVQALICLGERVGAVRQNDGPTERCITREIKAFIKWSERDGGYYNRRFLPVLVVVTAKPGQSNARVGDSLMSQLRFLANQHREYLANPSSSGKGDGPSFRRAPPLLYGILVVKTLVVVFTYDSSLPNPDLMKTIAFNFTGEDSSQEVWDCLGIAAVVVCARNYLMSIKDEFEAEEDVIDPDL